MIFLFAGIVIFVLKVTSPTCLYHTYPAASGVPPEVIVFAPIVAPGSVTEVPVGTCA